jgi:RNA polymerase sigma-70 factor (ECF subfamily)
MANGTLILGWRKRWNRSLLRFIGRRVPARVDIEDLAQETYLRAFRAWDRFDGGDVRAWLHTIGLRLAFNERSRARRWSDLLRSRRHSQDWVTNRDLDLHAALGGLRREHRAALLLNVVDGYTQEQVAEMLDVAPGTVASWVSRAKQHLRVALEERTDG